MSISPLPLPLDIIRFPLNGRQFVEASAGTGKTFAMAHFYLRLIIETELSVERILVLSFTRAATDELKQRIRKTLVRARDLLNGFVVPDEQDKLIGAILHTVDPEDAKRRLIAALLGFDGAAIFTIHSFCQRLLRDWAFETGQPLEIELTGDELPLLTELAADFWRKQITQLPPIVARKIVNRKWTPDMLAHQLSNLLGREWEGGIKHPKTESELAELHAQYRQLRATALAVWNEAAITKLLTTGNLNGTSYPLAELPGLCAAWGERLRDSSDEALLDEILDKDQKFLLLTAANLAKRTNKGKTPPAHPFFTAAQALYDGANGLKTELDQRLNALQFALFRFLEDQRAQRLRERRQMSFSELPNAVVRALRNGTQGVAWAAQLQQQFPVALIDEFQDTDSLQWALLQAMYPLNVLPRRSSENPDENQAVIAPTLICVGDPKQAIYRFRGADVFTYLQARETADVHSQTENFRSSPALIRAVNALFSATPTPFLTPDIRFTAVTPGHQSPPAALSPSEPALLVWPLGAEKATKDEITERIAQGVGAYLVEQLAAAAAGDAAIVRADGQRTPLSPKHFAVLVHSHHQGEQVYRALIQRRVPVVMRTQKSVFETPQAVAAQRLLTALLDYRNESAVAAALLDEPFEWSVAAVDAAKQQESAWEQQIQRFSDCVGLWREQGPLRMWRQLAAESGFQQRCLAHSDGERRLTNWLHLVELLQRRYSQARLGPAALLLWLIGCIQNPPKQDSTDDLLRLESDAERVKIVTIHSSKGLEYPIVICPFLCQTSRPHAEPLRVYHNDNNHGAVLDFTDDDEGLQQLRREEQQELQRLLYVALTRAQYRCALVWQPPTAKTAPDDGDDGGWSPLARLLGAGQTGDFDGLAVWQQLAAATGGAIGLAPFPTGTGMWAGDTTAAVARAPSRLPTPRQPARGWRFTSFSSLHDQRGVDIEAAVIDDWGLTTAASLDMHGFPRGAAAGRCLHGILQHAVPENAPSDAAGAPPPSEREARRRANRELVQRQLRLAGFDVGRWTPHVLAMMAALWRTPLGSQGQSLEEISGRQRQAEVAFTYPFQQFTASRWQQILRRHGIDEALPEFEVREGFLRGFIDVIAQLDGQFFVLDYKSNWLGDRAAAYHGGALQLAMNSGGYHFQALLYLVALHRQLKQRLSNYDPHRQLGGFRYLFLRGLDGTGAGVYGDESWALADLVQQLDRAL